MDHRVTTSLGPVRGVVDGDRRRPVALFRRLPYAAPPLGGLRWEPPVPPDPWRAARDARHPAPAPPQLPDPLAVLPGLAVESTSEDCLSVDVCAPVDARDRPVLVWIPGGGFVTGGTSVPTYDLRPLCADGDVVVVSVNYRLGATGFSAVGGHANVGLLDQLAALEWVRDHIADFGGDPTMVTVVGESAGGGSIMHLLTSPLRAGLFRRAIVQSGATDLTLSKTQAETVAERLRAALGGANLAAAPMEQVLAAQGAAIMDLAVEIGGMPFHPWIDGEVVTDRPIDALRDGTAADVELLIGTTTDEMRLFVDMAEVGLTGERLRRRVSRYLAARGRSDDAALDAVLDAHRAEHPNASPVECWAAVRTEAELRAPMLAAAAAHAHHAPTFVYEFDWPATGSFAGLGSCHAVDLPFTFGTTGDHGWPAALGEGDGPARLSSRLRAAWTAFASSGNPSHPGIGEWAPYDLAKRSTMRLAGTCSLEEDPRPATRIAWAAVRPD